MLKQDAEEFTLSLGQIVAGSWRQIALAKRLGVPKALGLSVEEWVGKRLGGYVKMSVAERLPAIEELKKEGFSNREIADVIGVDPKTVRNDLGGEFSPPADKNHNKNRDDTWIDGENSPPIDAIAGLAADDAVRKAMRQAEGREERREERLDNLADISRGNEALDLGQRYPIIYADPPWRYENPPIGASNRSIENHYPTMTLDELCSLPVGEIATDDALLYLWATAPKLAECFQVVTAWGFQYRTCLVWDKEVIGMGYHARNQHELLLVCKRGEIPPPRAGEQPSSVYRERRGEHSAKPVFFYEMIERAYPQLPKIELFSRSPRDGWAAWGNQAAVKAAE